MIKKKFTGRLGRSMFDTKVSFEEAPSPSRNKPNVIYIVMDDLGFAQLGCYGSDIDTPNIDRLAKEGLRYNNFHTTAICSATRASLLTGANHHSCGVNTTTDTALGLPNQQGGIDPQFSTIAEILKEYDYRTMAVGKWHLSSYTERSGEGPYHNYPLSKGFDTYYGFLDAHNDQWHPSLTRDNTRIDQPAEPKDGYHASEDFVDNAIQYIYRHHFSYPDQPFFLYLAFGAMHSPHHAPKEYIDRYKGKFDEGWDAKRQQWFERQKQIGLIPTNAELTDRNEHVPAWDSLDDKHKKAYARFMEVFAGMLTHTDEQIGRLIDYLEKSDLLDNTVIVFLSDNGASAEGGKDGHYNQAAGMDITSDYPDEVDIILKNYDTIGDEFSMPHYPTGWANAGNTPFQWYKAWTYEGGVKDPLIIRYPSEIQDRGGVREQFCHVSDITPTVMDILGFEKPEYIKGVHQKPFEGTSFRKAFKDPDADTGKHVQYFEMYGNRSIYKEGWKAVVNHTFTGDYSKDKWELYHVEKDYSEKYDVAEKYPQKLEELKEEWLIQAARYNVFPMDKFGFHAYKAQMAERLGGVIVPAFHRTYKNVLYPYEFTSDPGIAERNSIVHVVLERKDSKEEGVLLATGDRFGGVTLYIQDDHFHYVYNYLGQKFTHLVSDVNLSTGTVILEARLVRNGADSIEITLFVNGVKSAKAEHTGINYLKMGKASLRCDLITSVYEEGYHAPYEYNGDISEIEINVESLDIPETKQIEKAMKID